MNFQPERSEDRDRPDAWSVEAGPESVRSLMFHSNDDLPWPARDLDDASKSPAEATPAEATPAEAAIPDGATPQDAWQGDATPDGSWPDGGTPEVQPAWSEAATEPDASADDAGTQRLPEDVMDQTSQANEIDAAARLGEQTASAWPAAPSGKRTPVRQQA